MKPLAWPGMQKKNKKPLKKNEKKAHTRKFSYIHTTLSLYVTQWIDFRSFHPQSAQRGPPNSRTSVAGRQPKNATQGGEPNHIFLTLTQQAALPCSENGYRGRGSTSGRGRLQDLKKILLSQRL